jgi:hypothetical protein
MDRRANEADILRRDGSGLERAFSPLSALHYLAQECAFPCCESTLRLWRKEDRGPAWGRDNRGAIWYRESDLRHYVAFLAGLGRISLVEEHLPTRPPPMGPRAKRPTTAPTMPRPRLQLPSSEESTEAAG